MSAIEQLLKTMRVLRDPESGCPWIRSQSLSSIVPYTLEEAYELAEAVEQGDEAAIRDELADLLYHIVYYAGMAAEEGLFDFDAVAAHAREKLVRRHPHVFSEDRSATPPPTAGSWERSKLEERRNRHDGLLADVQLSQPSLIAAAKLQKRAAAVGFDWDQPAPVLDKIEEEIGELRREMDAGADPSRLEDEIGDLLFACVNAARHCGCEPESALRAANRKFIRRFQFIERSLADQGKTLGETGMEAMEELWQKAKGSEE